MAKNRALLVTVFLVAVVLGISAVVVAFWPHGTAKDEPTILDDLAAKSEAIRIETRNGNGIRIKERQEAFDQRLLDLKGKTVRVKMPVRTIYAEGVGLQGVHRDFQDGKDTYRYELILLSGGEGGFKINPKASKDWLRALSNGDDVLVTGTIDSVKPVGIGGITVLSTQFIIDLENASVSQP